MSVVKRASLTFNVSTPADDNVINSHIGARHTSIATQRVNFWHALLVFCCLAWSCMLWSCSLPLCLCIGLAGQVYNDACGL